MTSQDTGISRAFSLQLLPNVHSTYLPTFLFAKKLSKMQL